MVTQVNLAREGVIPLSESRTGKNGFIVSCKPQDRSQLYFVCQHVVLAMKEKRIGSSFQECQDCIGKGECIAVKMMIAERKEDRCLFFSESAGLRILEGKVAEEQPTASREPNRTSDGFQRGWHLLDNGKPKAKAVSPRAVSKTLPGAVTSLNDIDANMFSGVIDHHLSE